MEKQNKTKQGKTKKNQGKARKKLRNTNKDIGV